MDIAALSLSALALGAAYALVALGFVLTVNAIGAVNFAHGDLVMAGGFTGVLLASMVDLPGPLLLIGAMGMTAAFGLALSAVAYFPLRCGPPVGIYISTIAVGIALQNTVTATFGGAPRRGPPLFGNEPIEAYGIAIGNQALATICAAAVASLALYTLLYRTNLGRRVRAAALDPPMAQAIGINTTLTAAASFAIAASLAGMAGFLLAPTFLVTPTEGNNFILKAYIATALGGWGSLRGAASAALLVAIFETLMATMVNQVAAEIALYVAMLAILWVRPQGLFGEAAGRRA